MKYTLEERLDIGRRIYNGEISRYQAAEEYGISDQTARDYMRLYRDINFLPQKNSHHKNLQLPPAQSSVTPESWEDYKKLESMTKEELIREVMRARIREARLKKGYEVKGDGTVILYDIENTKS